jgi:hypothetical protein
MKSVLTAAAALAMLFTTPSFAGVITRQIDFSFSGVAQVSPLSPVVPPPVSPVTGSFTLTFDPTQAYANQTAGLITNSLNLTSTSAIGFSYFLPQDILTIGGTANGVTGVSTGVFDFSVRMDHFMTAPVIGSAGYSQGGPTYAAGASVTGTNVVGNLQFTLTVEDPTKIPEPMTMSLFVTGLAGAAALRRRRKQ